MLATLALSCLLVSSPDFSFRTLGPYRSSVPAPETILGYSIGDRHTVFHDQDRVMKALANSAKDRVRLMPYGKSTEGRELKVLVFGSPQNIQRLDQIQKDLVALAKSRNDDERAVATKRAPAVVWINQCIHGDETASFESAMELAYCLAASDNAQVKGALENTLVILNPVYNPDGHERYVVAYNSLPTGNPEQGSYESSLPSAFYGRTNHYRFDMNRDRISMSQAETRQEVAMFLRWNPHVYVDQHGQTENYFFPPVQQSLNVNVDRNRYNKWTDIFGRETAKSFDQAGWTYFIRDDFDFYNACFLDTHTTLMGAIGMTHETDGGRVLSRRRSDDTILTMRDGAAKHFTSALAVIRSASANREALIESYSSFKRRALSGEHAGKFKRVVVTGDRRELARFQALLARSGIESKFAQVAFTQSDAHDYWSEKTGDVEFPRGSLVVDMNQSQGPLAKALLEPGSDFEPDFIKRQLAKRESDKKNEVNPEIGGFEFYDSTAWALPLAFNLQAWWCESTPPFQEQDSTIENVRIVQNPVGFVLHYSDQDDILFVAEALKQGFKVSQTTRTMQVDGSSYDPGTFLFMAARNQPGYRNELWKLARKWDVNLQPLGTSYPDSGRQGPGGGTVIQLRRPEIGILFGNTGSLSGGSLWYMMEQEFKLPFYGLSAFAASGNLSKYTCLVAPDGVPASGSTAIKTWVQQGGCLVITGDMATGMGESGFAKLDDKSSDVSLPGAFFKAEMNPLSFLSFGYARKNLEKIPFAAPVDGSRFYKAPASGGSAIQFVADEKVKKILSGWTWDDSEKLLAGVAWCHEVSVGRGRVVMFATDPTFRAQFPGMNKLLLNAMILGPTARD